MAFIRSEVLPDEVIEITFFENEEEALARICIGYDDETDAIYSVFVGLPKDPRVLNGREVHFDIVEMVTEDDQELEYTLKDGLETRRFLVGDDRKFALSCVCAAVNALVERHKPDTVFMMTVTPNLPLKALSKYERICSSLREVGYEGRRDSPFLGTQIWIMTRITHGT